MTRAGQRHTIPARRRQEIVVAIRAGATGIAPLAQRFGVSQMTIRRDLAALAREGAVELARGGAVALSGERPFAETAVVRWQQKDRIGAAAAALVADGQTVMVDIGTTTLQAARHLHGRRVTVVTTSMAVYEELAADEGIELILPGGRLRRNYRSLVGELAVRSLRQLRADLLLLGTSGVDAELASWDSTAVELPIKRTMIEAANEVVLLADAAKLTMRGGLRVCGAEQLDRLVTDRPLAPAAAAAAARAGVAVTVA